MLPILGFGYNAPDTVTSTTSELKVTVGDLVCLGTHIIMHLFIAGVTYYVLATFIHLQTPSILSLKVR